MIKALNLFQSSANHLTPALMFLQDDGSLQFLNGGGGKSESFSIDLHVKMSHFRAEINIFSAW